MCWRWMLWKILSWWNSSLSTPSPRSCSGAKGVIFQKLLLLQIVPNTLIRNWVLSLQVFLSTYKWTYFKLFTAPGSKLALIRLRGMSKVGGRSGHLHVHPAPHLRQAYGPHVQVIWALNVISITKPEIKCKEILTDLVKLKGAKFHIFIGCIGCILSVTPYHIHHYCEIVLFCDLILHWWMFSFRSVYAWIRQQFWLQSWNWNVYRPVLKSLNIWYISSLCIGLNPL